MPNAPLRLVVVMCLSVPFVQGQNDSNRPYDSVLAHSVAEGKDVGTVGHLLQLGADPNSKTSEGVPVLIEAMHMTDRFLMPPMQPSNVLRIVLPLLKKAKLEWKGWHGFRRGVATELHRSGVQEV
jgi:hypothetical protein